MNDHDADVAKKRFRAHWQLLGAKLGTGGFGDTHILLGAKSQVKSVARRNTGLEITANPDRVAKINGGERDE